MRVLIIKLTNYNITKWRLITLKSQSKTKASRIRTKSNSTTRRCLDKGLINRCKIMVLLSLKRKRRNSSKRVSVI